MQCLDNKLSLNVCALTIWTNGRGEVAFTRKDQRGTEWEYERQWQTSAKLTCSYSKIYLCVVQFSSKTNTIVTLLDKGRGECSKINRLHCLSSFPTKLVQSSQNLLQGSHYCVCRFDYYNTFEDLNKFKIKGEKNLEQYKA